MQTTTQLPEPIPTEGGQAERSLAQRTESHPSETDIRAEIARHLAYVGPRAEAYGKYANSRVRWQKRLGVSVGITGGLTTAGIATSIGEMVPLWGKLAALLLSLVGAALGVYSSYFAEEAQAAATDAQLLRSYCRELEHKWDMLNEDPVAVKKGWRDFHSWLDNPPYDLPGEPPKKYKDLQDLGTPPNENEWPWKPATWNNAPDDHGHWPEIPLVQTKRE